MAKNTRTAKPVMPNLKLNGVEQYLSEFAVADARISEINAQMDIEITKIRENYGMELLSLEAKKKAALEVIQFWAETNKEEYFGKKRSVDMTHGVVGFRMGTWKATLAKGVKKWDEVLEACRTIAPEWIRTKEEVNKELMINTREVETERLASIGVMVVQEETFFVELKKEQLTT